jgi:hypothetical protein
MHLAHEQRIALTAWALRLVAACISGAIVLIADKHIWPLWLIASSSAGKIAGGLWLAIHAALALGCVAVIENGIRLFRADPVAVWPILRGFVLTSVLVGIATAYKFSGVLFALGIATAIISTALFIALNRLWIQR